MLGPSISTIKAAKKKEPVKTILRVRPFLPHESLEDQCLWVPDNSTVQISNYRNQNEKFSYNFDRCFDVDTTQDQVFATVRPFTDKLFEFKNATVFAYGITGAGKTFTMDGSTEAPGIIPRAARHVFDRIKRLNVACPTKVNAVDETEIFTVKIAHLEIYCEKVYDLARSDRNELHLRQDTFGNIIVADLSEKVVQNFSDFERHYMFTRENRSTAATQLNEKGKKQFLTKLNLIDLAGSEDNRKTGNDKNRMIESGNINKSLFMLNQVVDALNTGASNIPYRNSKLTRLLQDSLGGASDALMITNVAPCGKFYLDTLKYALIRVWAV